MKQTWRQLALLGAVLTLSLALVACAGESSAAGPEGNGSSNPGGNISTPAPGGHPDRPTTSDGGSVPGLPATPGGGIGGGSQPNSGGGSGSGGGDPMFPTVEELAPIDELESLVLESYPPQYAVRIVSGLPSGCASYHATNVARTGTTIEIEVINLVPAPSADIACTMIYGMHEQTVNLGSDFESGVEYTVIVNGKTLTFTAQ
jgi:hypothetical protein